MTPFVSITSKPSEICLPEILLIGPMDNEFCYYWLIAVDVRYVDSVCFQMVRLLVQ